MLARQNDWLQTAGRMNVDDVVIFDAFWDKPSKVSAIYLAIESILESEKRDLFMIGLQKFNDKQMEIKSASRKLLASCLLACRNHGKAILKGSDHGFDDARTKKTLEENILRNIHESIAKFVASVSVLYKISSHNPTISARELRIRFENSTEAGDLLKNAGIFGSVAGTAGAGIGAAIGALIGSMAGGVGAAPGAVLGAKIGVALGGFAGTVSGSAVSLGNTYDGRITSSDEKTIENVGLAHIWALSYHGFGLRPEINAKQTEKLVDVINSINKHVENEDSENLAHRYNEVINKLDDVTV